VQAAAAAARSAEWGAARAAGAAEAQWQLADAGAQVRGAAAAAARGCARLERWLAARGADAAAPAAGPPHARGHPGPHAQRKGYMGAARGAADALAGDGSLAVEPLAGNAGRAPGPAAPWPSEPLEAVQDGLAAAPAGGADALIRDAAAAAAAATAQLMAERMALGAARGALASARAQCAEYAGLGGAASEGAVCDRCLQPVGAAAFVAGLARLGVAEAAAADADARAEQRVAALQVGWISLYVQGPSCIQRHPAAVCVHERLVFGSTSQPDLASAHELAKCGPCFVHWPGTL